MLITNILCQTPPANATCPYCNGRGGKWIDGVYISCPNC